MGTRADFYIRNDKSMEYLGSIAWDGYEIDDNVLDATTEEDFRAELQKFLIGRDDSSFPKDHGWPWPWNNSETTDYSYVYENGKVMASNWGYALYDPRATTECDYEGEEKIPNFWPDMAEFERIRWDKGSGILVITAKCPQP